MFALPNLSILLSPFILTVSIGLSAVIAFMVVGVIRARGHRAPPVREPAESGARKCQYCRRGEAVLREETVRLDGADLVDVRCYVCSSCGLPQWWVERGGISPHVR